MGSPSGGGFRSAVMPSMVLDPETGEQVTQAELSQRQQTRQHHRDMLAQNLNDDGSPIRPKYSSELDPTTGKIKDDLQLKWGDNVKADQTAMDEIRKRGLEQGPSSWAQLALKQQGLEEQGAKSQAEQQANASRSSAESQLASTYGLSNAARERLAMQGSRDLMNAQQGVGSQGAMARAQIGLQDQNQKNQFLGMVPQYDMANANLAMQNKQGDLNAQGFNIGNTIGQNTYNNQMDLETYKAQMQKWAAEKQADATRNSGGGGKK